VPIARKLRANLERVSFSIGGLNVLPRAEKIRAKRDVKNVCVGSFGAVGGGPA